MAVQSLSGLSWHRGQSNFISADWREVRIRLPLSWRTLNYVGTIFGGSLYGSIDPIYMLMLIHNLGEEFVVWDRAATIRFLRPGRTTMFATFRLWGDLVEDLRAEAARVGRLNRDFEIELKDAAGEIHATCTQTLYLRRKGE